MVMKRIDTKAVKISNGFTLIELLVVISIVGILASVILSSLSTARDGGYEAKAFLEFDSLADAVTIYESENQIYPAHSGRVFPPELNGYISTSIWPDAAWPGSVLEWNNWADPDTPGARIIQISIDFCPDGILANCSFPLQDWAQNFDVNSSMYYCIDGACRSDITEPANHPGYCVNC